MRTVLRIAAIAGGLAALAAIALAIAVATIDVNAFAGPLQQAIKDATGREVAIRSISLTRSLTPKLVFDDVALGNAPWGKAPQLLTAKRVEAQVALLPLLQRRVEVVRVALFDPVIALETAGEGRANWDFDRARGTAPDGAALADAASALGAFTIGNLAITRGTLTFRDGASGSTTAVAIDTLAMTSRSADATIDIDFRGKVDAAPLALQGDLGSLEALRQRRWPYPVRLRGEIAGNNAALAAKLTVTEGATRFDEVDFTYGPNAVKGDVTVFTGGVRPKLVFKLAAATIKVADLPAPPASAAAARAAVAVAQPARTYMFADDRVNIGSLRSADLDGDLAIDQLTLKSGRRIDRVHARIVSQDGHADLSPLEAAALGGSARGHLVIDAALKGQTRITLRLDAKGLELSALFAAFGSPRDVRGGKTDVTVDVAMQGDSPRQWVSTVSGTATAIVGPATLANSKGDATSAFSRLADAVNPFRDINTATELQCAVIRLPLANGIARVDRSIAMETKEIGVAASGTMDFRDETVDFTLKPRLRAGIQVKLVQFADLVHFRGPFTAPTVAIDAKGTAETIARLGAAYATGGLSLLGESLLASGTGGGECEAALGKVPPANAARAGPPPDHAKAPVDDLAKSLGRLFHR
jgi:AsmA family protein